jgi:8-oxo-dGTP pyrophosphatase MutT (NUDIX family)
MRIFYLEHFIDLGINLDADLKQIPSRDELFMRWRSSDPSPFSIQFPTETSRDHWLETQFQAIHAAGGLVINDEEQILFMMRRGKWDLPKGKLESGETPEIAALREIEEETGLADLSLMRPLTKTYHLYEEKNQWMFKTSYWFLVHAGKIDTMKPQVEEEITSLQWFNLNQLETAKQNTFANIRLVLDAYWDADAR